MYLPNGPTISEFSPTRTKLFFVFLTQFQIVISISIKYVITKQVTACRTCEIARESWDVLICPIYTCLAVYELPFILFDFILFTLWYLRRLNSWSLMSFTGCRASHEKKLSPWGQGELTVTTVVTAPGPMITAQSRLGEVTAQSRRGHSSITAQVTAQSRLAVTILVTVGSRWAQC